MNIQLIYFGFLIALLFYRARFVVNNCNYLDKDTTSTVNGFFICIIFLSHFSQYSGVYPNSICMIFKQLVVVSFLFYSGYGCMAQYLAKGINYLQAFPQKRILTTLVNFDIAIIVFIAVGLLLGKQFTLHQVVFSFIGWDSVGNSAWYIFSILLCYLCFWISFYLKQDKYNIQPIRLGACTVLVACCVFVLSRVKKQPFWYDTMMAFPLGVAYGLYRRQIEIFLARYYWLSLFLTALFFFAIQHIPVIGPRYWISFNLKSICFALLIVFGTMKIELNSPLLLWCGEHLFPIYIYQRIPMIVFSTFHPAAFRDFRFWIYCILSFAVTIVIAWQYRHFSFAYTKK